MHTWLDRLPTLLTRSVRTLARGLRRLVRTTGILALVLVALAFTRIPFDVHRWLGTAAGLCNHTEPRCIVVLGGSGMPSGPELLRLHHTAQLAGQHPQARIVLLHPTDSAVMQAMVDELLLRGVDGERIQPLLEGTNTRQQALAFVEGGRLETDEQYLLVTAPENMYRSLHTFRRAGVPRICGSPAWDNPMFIDLGYSHKGVGGKAYVPDVSSSNALRYDLWNRLKLELVCLREAAAIAYYGLNGWL